MNKKEKAQRLFEGIGQINDKFVDEAENYTPKKSVVFIRSPFVRVIAACLSVVLVFGICFIILNDGYFSNKSGSDGNPAGNSVGSPENYNPVHSTTIYFPIEDSPEPEPEPEPELDDGSMEDDPYGDDH